MLHTARGVQRVPVTQKDVGVAVASCGVGKKAWAVVFDLCKHLLAIHGAKCVAHINLQEHLIRLSVFGPQTYLARSSLSGIWDLHTHLLRLQVLSGFSHDNVHQELASESSKNVSNRNGAKAAGRFANGDESCSGDDGHTLRGERAVGYACAIGGQCSKKRLFAFRLQHLLQVGAAPPRRTAAGAWRELL